uniref:HECT-type E3 ubiquitin transferase n=1 Tax=Mesocestoides corti TaxID=53468 RepID=A0A5K3F3P8_MESCO
MKIDRRKIGNRCGYDQNECMLLAKRLGECPDGEFLEELRKIKVWNYGKCELGLWADILDRLDAILEDVTTKVGAWTLKVDVPGNEHLVKDVVTVLEFTGHLIEHSIYRCLYGSWDHILALFASSNMDILLAVLGLAYNFSKRSNYFARLDPTNKSMILDRLVSIAESWGGSENNFDLASCCQPDHLPPTAGKVCFEYQPESVSPDLEPSAHKIQRTSITGPIIIEEDFRYSNMSSSEIMEELLTKHSVPSSKQMALFARVRLAVYFLDHEKRLKCIKARLQAFSTLCYTFEFDDRLLYFGLMDELVDVLQLPEGEFMEIKACALRTMTAVFNLQRVNLNLPSVFESMGMYSFHGALPTKIRRWIQGLVDGTCDASGGSVNQQYTIALLSFLYHIASFEQATVPVNAVTLGTCGILDAMLQLIAWHVPRNDCLSYVTRAVRVTDQILTTTSITRPNVIERLVDRLAYEVDLILNSQSATPDDGGDTQQSSTPLLNTQRSGLMKSMLNLLKRLCLDNDWYEAIRPAMNGNLPSILRQIYNNSVFLFSPHLALFAMETITNYIYTYPSSISYMQDRGVTCDILTALTNQPLPQSRDFLVHLPAILITLALNTRGRSALCLSGILDKYLYTLISPDYVATMKAKRVRDFLSQITYNLSSNSGQVISTSLTASQMSNSIHDLLRSHSELRPFVFNCIIKCITEIVDMGHSCQASLIPPSHSPESAMSCAGTLPLAATSSASSSLPRISHRRNITSAAVIDSSTGPGSTGTPRGLEDEDDEDEEHLMFSGSDGGGSDADGDVDGGAREQPRPHPPEIASTAPLPSTSQGSAEFAVADRRRDCVLYLSDYILNVCKFFERLMPSMVHVTDGSCRHFLNKRGVHVLCDLITMPGLPYDFPVSPACAALCKIFELFGSYACIQDTVRPILETTETWIKKTNALWSEYASRQKQTPTSILQEEYSAGRVELLHGLVCISSLLCVLVQITNHIKPDFRDAFSAVWVEQDILQDLGKLYLNVLWEATLLLHSITVEVEAEEEVCPTTGAGDTTSEGPSAVGPSTSSASPASGRGFMPPFVETLGIYRILKPYRGVTSAAQVGNLLEAQKVVHHIIYVTSYFINSVNELCTTLTRFCVSAPHQSRRLIVNFSSTLHDTVPLSTKLTILSRVASVAIDALLWEPPSLQLIETLPPKLLHALRYSAFRLSHILLFDASTKTPQVLMLKAFCMLRGLGYLFGICTKFVANASSEMSAVDTFGIVVEEWLACADRLSNASALKVEAQRLPEADLAGFDVDKYTGYLNRLMLEPLSLVCRLGLVNHLSKRGVDHLLSLIINVAPFIFTEEIASNPPSAASTEAPSPTIQLVPETHAKALEAMGFTLADFQAAFGDAIPEIVYLLVIKRPNLDSWVPISAEKTQERIGLLKERLFDTCYQIAKHYKTDEVLHQISELILSSKQEAHCIESLVASATISCCQGAASTSHHQTPPDAEVSLHIVALLFTRCRFLCAQVAHRHRLPAVLCDLVCGRLWKPVSQQLLMLATLILDQYERTAAAIRLRKKAVDLYADSHNWAWFDDRAVLWHPQVSEFFRPVDVAFHNGATRALCDVDRRRYQIDFPTMTQINLEGMNRRPIMLMPNLPSFNLTPDEVCCHSQDPSDYERSIQAATCPEGLSNASRKALCLAMLVHMESGGISPGCANSLLRLLLRLSASSFDDAETLMRADALRILFDFPHPLEFSPQYFAFVGHILRQLFDDSATLTSTLRQIIARFTEGQVPFLYPGCRDLFYILTLAVPLVAKNEDITMELLKEILVLVVDEESLKDGIPPKSFIVSPPPPDESKHCEVTEPTERQKEIIAFLIHRVVRSAPQGAESVREPERITVKPGSTSAAGDGSSSNRPEATGVFEGSSGPPAPLVRLSKLDYLRYLVDLSMVSRAVTEFISKFTLSADDGGGTFVAYLFTNEFRDPNTTHLTVLLLETLVFASSPSVQSLIISEFKASLKALVWASDSICAGPDSVEGGLSRNQRIIAYMRFLDCLLVLPSQILTHIIKQIYKRQIPCDVAKLLAIVHCNVANTSQTLTALVRGLEYLAWFDRQINKRLALAEQSMRASTSVAENHVSVVTTVADAMMHTATETTQPIASSLAPTIVGLSEAATSVHHQTRPPPTPVRQHLTEEGDTWALAEDASEIEDTTVEDSNALLILDDGEDGRGGGGGGGGGSAGEDDTDDGRHGRRIGGSYGDEEDSYHDEDDDDDNEEDDDEQDEDQEEDEDEDDGEEGVEAEEEGMIDDADEDEAEEEGDEFTRSLADDRAAVVSPLGAVPSQNENTNLIATLVNDVLSISHNPRNPATSGGGGLGLNVPQPRRRIDGDIVLHFATVGGAGRGGRPLDEATNWGSSNMLPPDHRVVDLGGGTSGSGGRFELLGSSNPHTYTNDALITSVHAMRQQSLTLPPQHPIFQIPTDSEHTTTTTLRSVGGGGGGGIGGAPANRTGRFFSTVNNESGARGGGLSASRDSISSAILTLFPPSNRTNTSVSASGGFMRIGSQPSTPILVRTNLSSGPQPAFLSAAQSALIGSPPPLHYNAFGYDGSAFLRSSRRRAPVPVVSTQQSSQVIEQSELEADTMVWDMLTSLSEFQGAAITEAFTNVPNAIRESPSPSGLFTTLNNFRRLIDLARMLHGQEIADMLLITRHLVGANVVRRRNEDFMMRLSEYHRRRQQEEMEARELAKKEAEMARNAEGLVPMTLGDSGQNLDAQPRRHPGSTLTIRLTESDESHDGAAEPTPVFPTLMSSPNSPPSSTEQEHPAEPAPSSAEAPSAAPQPAPPIRVPVTDEETVASMIAEGMDPSFLDALPEEMRRELMTEHQRTLQLRSQLSSLQASVAEHVNAEFLASLPPNIQEEVLAQVRLEAAAENPSSSEIGASTSHAGDATGATAQGSGTPADNAAFLTSLPPSLRREVLADMEDSQIDLLSPDLQAEARSLRRENPQLQNVHHHHHQQHQEFTRAVPGRILPAFFRSRFDAGNSRWDSYFSRVFNAPPSSTSGGNLFGNLSPAALSNFQAFFTSLGFRNRPLLDHEGLAYIITVIITSSASPPLRNQIIPVLKRVLRNLCFYYPTRIWIISTIISLLKNLSEAPLPPSASSSVASTGPANANSIFGAGFEAALGSWVRIFHPRGNGGFVIHPQAANMVCLALLDVMADLTRASSAQFFPSLQASTSGSTEGSELETDFWEIVNRLNRGGGGGGTTSPRKSLSRGGSSSPARSRASAKHSQKFAVEDNAMDDPTCTYRARNRAVSTAPTTPANEAGPTHTIDYFSHLIGLLCHPVVASRPLLQERLLCILVCVVQDYFETHHPQHMIPQRSHTDGLPASRLTAITADPVIPPSGSGGEGATEETPSLVPSSSTSSSQPDLILPLDPAVTECLCDLVVSRKSTDQARGFATWLVILMSRSNTSTKDRISRLLSNAASELAQTISAQLLAVMEEVRNLPPLVRRPSVCAASHLHHSSSMTRLPDRFGEVGSSVFIGQSASSSLVPPPTDGDGELELMTLQPFATSRSEQSRLCRILRLMLHLTVSPEAAMQSIQGLSVLWGRLSETMQCLQDSGDLNGVQLLQPSVESLCLTHATNSPTAIVVRQPPPALRRLARMPVGPGMNSLSSLIHDLMLSEDSAVDLFSAIAGPPANLAASADHLAPLSPDPPIDLTRPMSPPVSAQEASEKPPNETSFISPISWFAEKHRIGLNHILRNYSGNLSESAFTVFLTHPKALDFDVKRRFFRQRFQSINARNGVSRHDDEPVVVSRERIFEDSYSRLHRKSPAEWKRKFVIRFQNEEGQDAGGLLREWYLLMSREIFNPNYCLFRVSPSDRVTYTINPASFINSNHLSYFKFVGRFIAKAIYDSKLLECYFTRSFYKHILGKRVRFTDLESEDYDFFKGLEYLLQHDVSELGYEITFSTEINEFGKNETRDLIENGRNIVVTEANKHEYVRLVCQERMTGAIRQQLNSFLEGFYEIIPKNMITIFNEQELELLISGLPSIDIDDLRANTTYSKYQPTSPQVEWFWQALESFDQEDRARFLQFLTGTSRVPLGGFANLEGMHGPTKFQISRAAVSSTNHLPSAHTCFNTLELPPYESYEQLRQRLLTAIRECCEGYGMA